MIVELSKIQFHQQFHPKNHQTAQETAKMANKTAKMAAKGQRVQTQIPLFATTCQFCQAVQPHQGKSNLSKILQTCPNGSKLVQIWLILSKLVKTHSNLSKLFLFMFSRSNIAGSQQSTQSDAKSSSPSSGMSTNSDLQGW